MWDFGRYPDHTALVSDKGMRMSYRELEDASAELSKHIPRRSLVFSFCKNHPGSVIGYISFIHHRIIPLPLNAQMDREMVSSLIEVYQPEYLWIPAESRESFGNLKIVFSDWQYLLLKTESVDGVLPHPDLALLLTTSGSTGSPKLVRQSYQNIDSNAASIASYLKLTAEDASVTTLPMNYTYGLSIINSHLLAGARILLTEGTIVQSEFWDFMTREKATSFGGVPYTYEILNKLKFCQMNLPDLRYLTQAGGRLSPALHQTFAAWARDNDKQFIVMYGQCEATARISYLPAESSLEKCGSIGIAIPGGRLLLLDEEGTEISGSGVMGELVYEGDNVTMGYAQTREDLAQGDERHGRLATGDLAKRDEDGFYYIMGRKKRFLKVYGNSVNLDEIDDLLKSRFVGIECTSGGTDDHIYIFVTSNEYEEELIDYISARTALNFKAFTVRVLSEIPKNDSGKVQYRELEQYYGI